LTIKTSSSVNSQKERKSFERPSLLLCRFIFFNFSCTQPSSILLWFSNSDIQLGSEPFSAARRTIPVRRQAGLWWYQAVLHTTKSLILSILLYQFSNSSVRLSSLSFCHFSSLLNQSFSSSFSLCSDFISLIISSISSSVSDSPRSSFKIQRT